MDSVAVTVTVGVKVTVGVADVSVMAHNRESPATVNSRSDPAGKTLARPLLAGP